MKKSTFILVAAAVSFALAGCEKKGSVEQQASGELIEKTFYANQGGKEKTSFGPSMATLWSDGDAIKVYPKTGGEGNDFTIEEGVGTSSATFTGQTTASDTYVAFYPAENAQSISGSTVTFDIPATQVITNAGSFNTNTVPMVGYTTNETFAMKNVGSLFEFKLKAMSGTPKVVKIELIDNNGENLAGEFVVDASVWTKWEQPTAIYFKNGVKTITINCGEYDGDKYQGIALNNTTFTKFYISIPAGVFRNGFTATLIGADGKVAEVTTTNDIHKDASKIVFFEASYINFTDCTHCTYTETVTDICGNTYNLVTIGTQTWMAENMRCNKYGTESEAYKEGRITIAKASSSTSSISFDPYYADIPESEKYLFYNLSDAQFAKLGYFYNWAAAVGLADGESQTTPFTKNRQGICPDGFHVPSPEEYKTFKKVAEGTDHLSGKHIKVCKGWNWADLNGDNATCFSALPAGYHLAAGSGSLEGLGFQASFWLSASTLSDKTFAEGFSLTKENGNYLCDYVTGSKATAYSVRCIKD